MKHLLFFCKAPMNALMFARPLRQFWSDPEYRLRFTGEGRGVGGAPEILFRIGFDGARAANRFEIRWRKWDAYISPDLFMPAPRARRRIQIFHGVSFKGKVFTPAIQRFSDLFLIGENQRRKFIERGLLPADFPGFHAVGMPKLDAFFDGSLDRNATLCALGADPARPVVLYAPTWRPESSIYGAGLEFIRAHARRDDFTLVIKLHDWMWDPATNPVDWKAAIPTLETPTVRFARGFDVIPLMHAADLLISDASSVANEYLLLNRPLVWLDAPELLKKYADTIDLEGWGRSTGPLVRNASELPEVCHAQISNPGEFMGQRSAAAADLFYNTGRATEVFSKTLVELLDRV